MRQLRQQQGLPPQQVFFSFTLQAPRHHSFTCCALFTVLTAQWTLTLSSKSAGLVAADFAVSKSIIPWLYRSIRCWSKVCMPILVSARGYVISYHCRLFRILNTVLDAERVSHHSRTATRPALSFFPEQPLRDNGSQGFCEPLPDRQLLTHIEYTDDPLYGLRRIDCMECRHDKMACLRSL